MKHPTERDRWMDQKDDDEALRAERKDREARQNEPPGDWQNDHLRNLAQSMDGRQNCDPGDCDDSKPQVG